MRKRKRQWYIVRRPAGTRRPGVRIASVSDPAHTRARVEADSTLLTV